MRHRRQTELAVVDMAETEATSAAPSTFLPGRIPNRYRPDPRATTEWRRVRRAALARDHATCQRCSGPASDVDHRIELVDGGAPFDLENLQALCASCHDAKSSEARYRRVTRATSSWGRMALCPRCDGSGRCGCCSLAGHVCGVCLGVRCVPERCVASDELPSQLVLAEVSSLAWAGALPRSE
jgi:5-methylcytosine-specific restriction endonuclease McrA